MAKEKAVNGSDGFAETCRNLFSGVLSCFLLVLVVVQPLIVHDAYFDLLETKYRCFCMLMFVLLAVMIGLGLILLVIDLKEFQAEHIKKLFSALHPKNWKETFSVGDRAVIVFWIVSAVSTFFSDYRYEAFWGNEGRYSGLFLITLYVMMYFLISHLWKGNSYVLQAFLFTAVLVSLFGITDYFQLDLLHFKANIRAEQAAWFTSTIGNINTYAAYLAYAIGCSTALFVASHRHVCTAWYYTCMVVTFFAIIMGSSDNAYLALGSLFALLPVLFFQSKQGRLRYVVILATFTTVIFIIGKITQQYADRVIGIDGLFQILANFSGLFLLAIVLWFVVVLYGKKTLHDHSVSVWPVKVWMLFLMAGFVVIFVMFFDANVLQHETHYGALGNYITFNDSWGTNRGYIWRKSLDLYREFPLLHKIFGYGPDTFGILAKKNFMDEMIQMTGQVFDAAHNEYLQFLVTIGPIGTAAYIIFFIANSAEMVSCWKKEQKEKSFILANYGLGCFFASTCYFTQAVVNLNLPITAPFLWMFMGMGTAIARQKRSQSLPKLDNS